MNEDIKKWIKDNLFYSRGLVCKKCKKEWFDKYKFSNQYNEIIQVTSFLDDINPTLPQRIWHIINDKLEKQKCYNPSCNNTTSFFAFTKGYLRTCCPSCAQFDPQTINKIKDTNIKKYGSEYGLSNRNVIEKRKKTVMIKYGVDNISKANGISEKKKQTCLTNYGTKWFLERGDILQKILMDKYGVNNILKLEEMKDKVSKTKKYDFYDYICTSEKFSSIKPLFTKEEYKGCCIEHKFLCNKCNTEFIGKIEDGDIPRCINCYPKHGNSLFQKEIVEYIKSIYNGNIEENNKIVLNGLEIDIYISDKKLAIECDGLYWHSEISGDKNKYYHINKTEKCEKQGIHLIHIFEDEWYNNTTIIKNKLKHIFQLFTEKIYARNCDIKIVNINDKKQFLNDNHIQGNDNSSINLGLYNKNNLVAVMTFCKQRVFINDKTNRTDGIYELSRYATSKNVVGGASKLLQYFIKNYKPTKIISYADRRWTYIDKNLYSSIGFNKINEGTPNYWYFGKGKSYKRYHRFNFAKHTLNKKLEKFDNNLSEWQNMKNNGWDRIWDCGNIKYELIIT